MRTDQRILIMPEPTEKTRSDVRDRKRRVLFARSGQDKTTFTGDLNSFNALISATGLKTQISKEIPPFGIKPVVANGRGILQGMEGIIK